MPARFFAADPAVMRIFAACVVAFWMASSLAQSPESAPAATSASLKKKNAEQPAAKTAATNAGPTWSQLTSRQKRALNPLANNWNSLSEPQKRKWLALSQNFAKLSETEQLKLQERMTDWTKLSSQQRTQARLNYAETRALTAEEKEAKWQAYQALSSEEKKILARSALPKPKGAAAAIKPVPAYKLAVTPSSRTDGAPLPPANKDAKRPGIMAAAGPVNKNTLLPRVATSAPRSP